MLSRMVLYRALLQRKAFDWSFSPLVRSAVVYGSYVGYLLAGSGSNPRAFARLLNAHRYTAGKGIAAFLRQQIKMGLEKWMHYRHKITPLEAPSNGFRRRILVLKPPRKVNDRCVEKGVLLVAGHHGELYRLVDVERLTRDYYLVFEPGWSGYASEDILHYCLFKDCPIVIMCPELDDYEFIKYLDTNLIPVRFGASDWVDPRIFRPIEGFDKDFDAVMVAVWGKYKRHHVLFHALRGIRRSGARVALAGMPWQGTREEIEMLVDYYEVGSHVTIFENLSPVEVNEVLNRSKVNMILSLREGANRSIFEGFFADVPGIVLRRNIGINKDYINQYTGKLVEENELAQALLWFREHWKDFSPRVWALANISPEVTTAKLNHLLKGIAESRGELWTTDIVAKCNSPEPTYYPDPSVAKDFPTINDILADYR